ncbi:MAG: hypothetical protein KTR30_25190 [Saprospiraceae bacterium]|nr:hypothetical protein [Saprospiraceae bacterium]
MKAVEIELSGVLEEEELEYYGGTFSIRENIRLGGTGSPKVYYSDGIPEFDELNAYVENEVSFVSFEMMKKGLILRLNRTQRMRCVGTLWTGIKEIRLTGYRKEVEYGRWLSRRVIVHRGILELEEFDGSISCFHVPEQNFSGLQNYFSKAIFRDFFVYALGTSPPDPTDSKLIDFLDDFI